jgi:hypothetical protein
MISHSRDLGGPQCSSHPPSIHSLFPLKLDSISRLNCLNPYTKLVLPSLAVGDDTVAGTDGGDEDGLGLREERLRGRVRAGDARERAVRGEERALDGDARLRRRGLEGDECLADLANRALGGADAVRSGLDRSGGRSVTTSLVSKRRRERDRGTYEETAVARSFSVDWVFARFATISRRSRLHWRLPIWRAAIGAAEQGKS